MILDCKYMGFRNKGELGDRVYKIRLQVLKSEEIEVEILDLRRKFRYQVEELLAEWAVLSAILHSVFFWFYDRERYIIELEGKPRVVYIHNEEEYY